LSLFSFKSNIEEIGMRGQRVTPPHLTARIYLKSLI